MLDADRLVLAAVPCTEGWFRFLGLTVIRISSNVAWHLSVLRVVMGTVALTLPMNPAVISQYGEFCNQASDAAVLDSIPTCLEELLKPSEYHMLCMMTDQGRYKTDSSTQVLDGCMRIA